MMKGMLGQYIVLVWLLALVSATDEPEKGCVNHPPSACPVVDLEDKVCHCQRIEADTTVICCNIHSEMVLKEGLSCAFNKKENSVSGQQNKLPLPPVTALHILNSTLEKLDVSLSFFQGLIGLSVTQSHISRIMGRFPSSVTCLNLSSNHLVEIDPQAFSSVPQLGYLDLSNNNLTHPPKLELRNPKAYFFIDLSGNVKLICKLLHELKMQKNLSTTVHFVHEDETFCSTPSKYNWFNSVNVIPFHQLDTIDKIDKNCPRGQDFECQCSMSRNVELNQVVQYFVTVDCSGQGLTTLPEELPPNTISLNVSNNNITHLDFIGTKPSYRSIDSIYLDNNRIESITVLEGSEFIDKFVRLSLRNNNIKIIPKYLLANAFDRNSFNKYVMLGKNKLQCDCSTAQVLKVWLLANKQRITDYEEVMCENFNNMRIVDLDQTKVCVYPRDWTDYIYYIIALEILLFVLLVTKVSYDYWVFKTKGYLPWPASKMPRLPCDWVFEL